MKDHRHTVIFQEISVSLQLPLFLTQGLKVLQHACVPLNPLLSSSARNLAIYQTCSRDIVPVQPRPEVPVLVPRPCLDSKGRTRQCTLVFAGRAGLIPLPQGGGLRMKAAS